MPVLVPNDKGLNRALDAGVKEIAVFGSATETFAQKNLNRSVAESLEMFRPVVDRARSNGLAVRGYLSMCFGDPWEGSVDPDVVAGHARTLFDMGITELSASATPSASRTPGQVVALLDCPRPAGDLRSTSSPCTSTTPTARRSPTPWSRCSTASPSIDASAGGLGGCPYAKSATGNLATEDLLWQLHGLGIDTGVDLHALVRTSVWMAEQLGRPSPRRAVQALAKEIDVMTLDTRLTDEQLQLKKTVEDFAKEVVAPGHATTTTRPRRSPTTS